MFIVGYFGCEMSKKSERLRKEILKELCRYNKFELSERKEIRITIDKTIQRTIKNLLKDINRFFDGHKHWMCGYKEELLIKRIKTKYGVK